MHIFSLFSIDTVQSEELHIKVLFRVLFKRHSIFYVLFIVIFKKKHFKLEDYSSGTEVLILNIRIMHIFQLKEHHALILV